MTFFFLVFNLSWEGPPILNLPRASGMLRLALSQCFQQIVYRIAGLFYEVQIFVKLRLASQKIFCWKRDILIFLSE